MKILAIDYGEKRIGVAIGVNGVIETLPEIDTDKTVFDDIKKISREETVELILVGISEGETAKKTKKFAQRLFSIVELPVEFVDETLTTWDARGVAGVINKKNRPVDSISAALILERYFLKNRKEVADV